MNRKLFFSIFLLTAYIFAKAQDEFRVFEKVEVNANTNQKTWNEHIMKQKQLPDSV